MSLRHPIFATAFGLAALVSPVGGAEPAVPAVPEPAKPAAPAAPAAPATPAVPAPDFGDSSSSTLTTKAWDALNGKNPGHAKVFAEKCIELYRDKALEMQKGLKAPATEQEEVFKSWALNDVGTCHFILGQALEAEGKGKEAIVPYRYLTEKLAFAQCWDAKGWFWKPADAARERVKALEFDTLK